MKIKNFQFKLNLRPQKLSLDIYYKITELNEKK